MGGNNVYRRLQTRYGNNNVANINTIGTITQMTKKNLKDSWLYYNRLLIALNGKVAGLHEASNILRAYNVDGPPNLELEQALTRSMESQNRIREAMRRLELELPDDFGMV